MARRRFLVEQFRAGAACVEGEQAHHLVRVLRAKPGQEVELSDGRQVWLGRVHLVESGRVEFDLTEQLEAPAPGPALTLLVSLIKFDRFGWILEKAVEFGVARVVPLAASRSIKRLAAAAPARAARWKKIVLNAAQQSRRTGPPVIEEVVPPAVAFSPADGSARILLSESKEAPLLRTVLQETSSFSAGAALAVGPEGGWTLEEFRAARAAGFEEASLGSNILRAETATLAALAILSHQLATGKDAGV